MSLAGVAFAATILYVHGQIDSLGDGYTSFCSVNDSINCDRVLSSAYAKIAGVPVAWMALLAYLGLAALFAAAARDRDKTRRARLLELGTLAVLGGLVFSAYMAVVSVVRLETICLLCTGLYVVSVANAALALAAVRLASLPGGRRPLRPAAAAAVLLASGGAVTGLFLFAGPQASARLAADIRSGDDVRRADPAFYDWYQSLPKVDASSLVRSDQQAVLGSGKVVVVDFFDLECAHCRKNYLLTKELRARRPEEVEIVHRHFPLDATCNDVVTVSIHRNACRAAEAVECAGLQGKHDEMLEILFKNQNQLFAENLPRLAAKIGLDKDALQRCLDEHTTLPKVLEDARAGVKLDIKSTPTVFIGRRRIQGTLEEVGKYEMAVLVEASPAN